MTQQQNISDTTIHMGGDIPSPRAEVSSNALSLPPCGLITELQNRYWSIIKRTGHNPYFLSKKDETISILQKINELKALSKKRN